MRQPQLTAKPPARPRRFPIGAEIRPDGAHFRVWAPSASQVYVHLPASDDRVALESEEAGYWSGHVADVGAGTRYSFLLDQRGPFPDPASRSQPDGPHGASGLVDPNTFRWTDQQWSGADRRGQVVYEMHIGTFTPAGTWRSALEQLPSLADMGITLLEVMPVAEFAGAFGWGYDGVSLFAPTRLYGSPDDMRTFVDRAHALGLGVILDVVYNHVGPDGNYLKEYAPGYFSTRYENEWGDPINFDGPDAGPVREFFVTNAAYWTDEFHIDGLRLDATQQIFDASTRNIMNEISHAARAAAPRRKLFIVAENEPQDTQLVRHTEEGGYELDALWNDDFHHSVIAAATGMRDAYYADHRGTPQELISAIKYGFLFQGQYYAWQKQNRGTTTQGLPLDRFVHFIENHDQVANSTNGTRLHQVTSPGRWRALTALLLLGPETPMLFQGEEFAATAPFVFFADHDPDLARKVQQGRAEFLSQFASAAAARQSIPVPHDAAVFERCKLDPAERDRHVHAVALHKDLIGIRRSDSVFSRAVECTIDGAVIDAEAFVLRYFGVREDRLLVINLGPLLRPASIAEPLVAPPRGCKWEMLWSSEAIEYGGIGAPPIIIEDGWFIPAHSATVLKSTI